MAPMARQKRERRRVFRRWHLETDRISRNGSLLRKHEGANPVKHDYGRHKEKCAILNEELKRIFQQSSSVSFIDGRRDSGKTAFALRIAEDALEEGITDKIAGNIRFYTPDSRYTYICYHDRAIEWLETKGKKIFLLDELGKHLYRMSFMSKMAKIILELCQLVRKYDAHLIGMAPSEAVVNKLFANTDIRDLHIHKVSRTVARIKDYVLYDIYTITDIPKTTFPFISKDPAIYDMIDPTRRGKLESLAKEGQAALLYCHLRSLRKVAARMDCSHEEVRKLLDKHVASRKISLSTVNPE